MIIYFEEALVDLRDITYYTWTIWNEAQSDEYLAFLTDSIQELSLNPSQGEEVEDHPGLWMHLVKSSGKRESHGYRVFYEFDNENLYVVRLIHMARYWQALITDEE